MSVLDYDKTVFGTWGTGSSHVSANSGAYVNLGANGETITGNFLSSFHLNFAGNAVYTCGGCQTNIPSAVSWVGGGWLSASGNPFISLSGWSTAGAGVAGSTGPQAALFGPGFLVTAASAACASVFPGSGGCTLSAGFQDNAGDNQTSPMPVGGVSCPSGITAGTVTVVKGVVTHC